MARTKADQTLIDDLTRQVRLATALRWSTRRDIKQIPKPVGGGRTDGFVVIPSRVEHPHSIPQAVRLCWSTADTHGEGKFKEHGASRDGIPLYASMADALCALRYDLEEMYAARLAAVDAELVRVGVELPIVPGRL